MRYTQTVLQNGAVATMRTNTVQNLSGLATGAVINCQTVSSYQNIAQALITFPPGYVLTAGSNPIHQQSAIIQVPPSAAAALVAVAAAAPFTRRPWPATRPGVTRT